MADQEENSVPGFRKIGHLLSQIENSASNATSNRTTHSDSSETTGSRSQAPMLARSIGTRPGGTGVAIKSGTIGRPEIREMPRTIEQQEAVKHLCGEYLMHLKARYSPANEKEIGVLLAGLCSIYGTPDCIEISTPIYVDLLEYPLEVLQAAIKSHCRSSKWFPKPSELIELCEPLMGEIRWKIQDAESDLAYVSQEIPMSREEFYRNQHIGDGHGSAGSSALRATDALRVVPLLTAEEHRKVAESLANWPKIPVPEDPE